MDVTEQTEAPQTTATAVHEEPPLDPRAPLAEEPVGHAPAALPETPPPLPTPEWRLPPRSWLRLAYAFEFWIALVAIFTVWSQVGGQAHLDLIAWYLKLACAIALAWCGVRMTSAMVENPKAWNRRAARWFLGVVAVSTLIAGITYWYHLHEVLDEPDTDENSATTVWNRNGGGNCLQRIVIVTRDRQSA